MKTKMFAKAIALGVLAWLFLAPNKVSAQVANPYSIMNNTPCKMTVKYTIFSWTPNGCTNPCASGVISVPPSPPPTMIPWPAACVGCGVQIEILAVNGVALMPTIIAGFNTPPMPPHDNGPDPSGCSPSGIINLDVHPHGADINP